MRRFLLAAVMSLTMVLGSATIASAYDLWDCKNVYGSPGVKLFNGSNQTGESRVMCTLGTGIAEDHKLEWGQDAEPLPNGIVGLGDQIDSFRIILAPFACRTYLRFYDDTNEENSIVTYSWPEQDTWTTVNINLSSDHKNRANSVRLEPCY